MNRFQISNSDDSHTADASSSGIRQRVISSINYAANSEPIASTSAGFSAVPSGSTSYPVTAEMNGGGLGARFSKNSQEREVILQDRKQHLLETHRRRYLDSLNAVELRKARHD